MIFELARETRIPEYSSIKKSKKTKSLLLIGAFILAGLSPLSAETPDDLQPLLGVQVVAPKILSSEQVQQIVNETFKNTLGFELKDKKAISLKSGKNTVIFFAESYNSQKKIAFEWMGKSEYHDGKNNYSKIISPAEMKWIDHYQFDHTYIVVSYGINMESIQYDISKFIDFYTNQ
ncbi:MAG: hypothetical protein HPY53_05510 [Brevinematales bacterium]|nr:hypothetical protein [Brevinematales bacterium]